MTPSRLAIQVNSRIDGSKFAQEKKKKAIIQDESAMFEGQ